MIVGAGLAGLITAQVFPRHPIVDASPEPTESHKALLRFRSDAVSKLTGVDFRRVTVRKGIWYRGDFLAPDIQLANLYTQKCLGKIIGDRSIWNLEPVDRWIAPEDFYDQLIESVRDRTEWGVDFEFAPGCGSHYPEGLISTAPLPLVMRKLGIEAEETSFERQSIAVERFRVPRADAHQTVYLPDPELSAYRASITGDLLILEHAGPADGGASVEEAARALALPPDVEKLEEVSQRYGKIAPIPAETRKALVARLTADYDIFSIGRFATWRNILLDDVVQDASVIKRLITSSHYDRRLRAL